MVVVIQVVAVAADMGMALAVEIQVVEEIFDRVKEPEVETLVVAKIWAEDMEKLLVAGSSAAAGISVVADKEKELVEES